jgi:hypothetical protein
MGMKRAGFGLILLGAAGCITVIRPPLSPEDPVPVVVVDYGHHSSLLLPLPEGGSMEYAYGDWGWFALNRDEWYRACPTLCWPNQGALGRRRLRIDSTRPAAQEALPCREAHEFQVARLKVGQLLQSLDQSFQRHIETRVDNPAMGLEFVHGEFDYCFLVNCNHRVALWLRELECGVGGCASFSRFEVEPP